LPEGEAVERTEVREVRTLVEHGELDDGTVPCLIRRLSGEGEITY
jgi:hypothetical protein